MADDEARRGVFWRDQEVQAMLDFLLEEGAGRAVMRSTHLANMPLFRRVSARLAPLGFERTPHQCRAKFKRVKGHFFDSLEDCGGFPPMHARSPFFDSLRRLWEQGGRPSVEDRRHAATQRGPKRRRVQRPPSSSTSSSEEEGEGPMARSESSEGPAEAARAGPSTAGSPRREDRPAAEEEGPILIQDTSAGSASEVGAREAQPREATATLFGTSSASTAEEGQQAQASAADRVVGAVTGHIQAMEEGLERVMADRLRFLAQWLARGQEEALGRLEERLAQAQAESLGRVEQGLANIEERLTRAQGECLGRLDEGLARLEERLTRAQEEALARMRDSLARGVEEAGRCVERTLAQVRFEVRSRMPRPPQ